MTTVALLGCIGIVRDNRNEPSRPKTPYGGGLQMSSVLPDWLPCLT